MTLPTNVASTYSGNIDDPSVSLHQQHHDIIHGAVNSYLNDKATAPILVTDPAYGIEGTSDHTAAVQAALDVAASSGRPVLFPARPNGAHYVVGNLTIKGDGPIRIQGHGGNTVLRQKANSDWILSINQGKSGSPDPSQNTTGIVVENLRLVGTVATEGFSEHKPLLNISAVSDVTIRACKFEGWRGDAIQIVSSNAGNTERHNRRVLIIDNAFDGINGENRQAISVIDGWQIRITNNTFRNCTRANMPGAIDIEPNNYPPFPVIRDIAVVGNTFDGVGGGGGVIGMFLPMGQASLSNPMSGLLIRGNIFRNCSNTSLIQLRQVQTPSASSQSNNVTVADNVAISCKRPFTLDGVKGVTFHDNVWDKCDGAGYIGTTYPCRDVTVHHDRFVECAKTAGVTIGIEDVTNFRADSLEFVNCGRSDKSRGIAFYLLTGTTSNLTIEGCRYYGSRMTHAVAKGTITTSRTRNTYWGNRAGSDVTGSSVVTGVFGAKPVAVTT